MKSKLRLNIVLKAVSIVILITKNSKNLKKLDSQNFNTVVDSSYSYKS
jgi:flagellar biosynthesis regulator FlaF